MAGPAFSLNLSLDGLDGVQISLLGLRRRVKDATPAFTKIDKHVTLMFRRQFQTEGRFGGTPWKPLAPSTLRARAQAGRGRGGILRDTNQLWASLVTMSPYSIRVIQPQLYTRGTSLSYAEAHQTGKRRSRKTRTGKRDKKGKMATKMKVRTSLPKRPMIPEPMPASISGVWEKILADYFAGASS